MSAPLTRGSSSRPTPAVLDPNAPKVRPFPPVDRMRAQGFRVHQLKTWVTQFRAVKAMDKTVEIRCNQDRDFGVGDLLYLAEWDIDVTRYTGDAVWREVTHVLVGVTGLVPSYVALSIDELAPAVQAKLAAL